MSRVSSAVSAVRKHLPQGRRLPAGFAGFAKLVVNDRDPRKDRLRLIWTNPRPLLNADRRVLDSLLPFARLGDGGVVALWWANPDGEPSVIHCDSEGQYTVVAPSFADFLARLARRSPELWARLELDAPIDTSTLVEPPGRRSRIPASLGRQLDAWVKSHSLSSKPDSSAAAHALARKLQTIARSVLRDGLSTVYKLRDFHWTLELRVVKKGTTWQVTYLDFGKWLPLPRRYDLLPLLAELSALMKHPRQRKPKEGFQLSIWKDGHVFVDGGNRLTIDLTRVAKDRGRV